MVKHHAHGRARFGATGLLAITIVQRAVNGVGNGHGYTKPRSDNSFSRVAIQIEHQKILKNIEGKPYQCNSVGSQPHRHAFYQPVTER